MDGDCIPRAIVDWSDEETEYYKRRSDYYKERIAHSCASHCIKEGCRYYTETICLKQEDIVKQIEQDWIDIQHDK